MKRLKLLWRVIRSTHSDYLIYTLVVLIFAFAGILTAIEPGIRTYGDAVWYCFSVVTTIGFGDMAATTFVGRVLSIVLGVFGILVVGLVVGVVVAYYNELIRARHSESLELFAEKLERLPELSREELAEMSVQVKRTRSKAGHPLRAGGAGATASDDSANGEGTTR